MESEAAGQINSEQHRISTVNNATTRASQPAPATLGSIHQWRRLCVQPCDWSMSASVLLAGPISGRLTSVMATHSRPRVVEAVL